MDHQGHNLSINKSRRNQRHSISISMNLEEILALLPSLIAAVGVWVSLNNEVAKLKGRIYRLESDNDELKTMLKECVEGIHELKILLAKKGM